MPLVDSVTGAGAALATAGQAKVKEAKELSQPIEPLDNDIARLLTHLHPVLLAGNFILSFSGLVMDPVGAMALGLLPLVLSQALYCAICLPVAGSTPTGKSKSKVKKGVGAFATADARGKRASEVGWMEKIVPTLLSLLLTQLAIPVLFFIQVLLGAPVTTHLLHTVLSSTHAAVLAVFPLVYVHGADPARWLEIAGLQCPMDEVFGATVGTLVGAWLGAVPIPLDWDRAWQAWPVTVVTGMYAGFVVGKLMGKWIVKGKRISFA